MSSSEKKKKGGIFKGTRTLFTKLLFVSVVFTALPVFISGLLIVFSYEHAIESFFLAQEEEFIAAIGKPFISILQNLRSQAFLTVIMVIALSLFGASLLARQLIRPIKKLTRGAEKVRRGSFDVQVETDGEDEIGQLTKTFNEMVDQLKKQTFLREQKETLEVRVAARTKELEELNKQLESQVKERTSELEKRVKEYEKMNKLMVGRELKMIELKKELKKAREELERIKKEGATETGSQD